MTSEDYVGFEIAKLLDEKGIRIPGSVWYDDIAKEVAKNKK